MLLGIESLAKDRKYLILVAGFVVASLVGFVATTRSAQVPPLSAFVAWGHLQEFTKSGRTPGVQQFIIAHREDGSFVSGVSVTSPTGEVGMATTIFIASELKLIWLEPFTQTAQTHYLPQEEASLRVQEQRLCDDASVREQIEAKNDVARKFDQEVVKVTHKPFPDAIATGWVAPGFDCLAMEEMRTYTFGSRRIRSVDKFQPGAPDASLFEVPDGYVERSPVEMESRYDAKYPGHRILTPSQLATSQHNYTLHRKK